MDADEIINKPLKHFRAKVAKGSQAAVDPDGGRYGFGVINQVSIITRGEALGHGLWVDADFLSDTAAAINSRDVGLKARFTHPGLSSDGLGTYLGKVHDARVIGEQVIADLHFKEAATKTPDGDLAAYVMQLAMDAPEDFGVSIVFDHDIDRMQEHMADNSERDRFISPDEDNKNNHPHAMLLQLRAADVVDSPAANPNGLFHRDQEIAQEAEALIEYTLGLSDARPQLTCLSVDADRVSAAVQRFLSRHNLKIEKKGSDPMPEHNPPAETQAPPQPTREQFAAELKRFTTDFGTKGAEWFADGKSHSDCQSLMIADLKTELAAKDEEIRSLQQKLAAIDLGEKRPVGFGDDTPQDKKRQHGLSHKIRINGRQYN